MQLKDIIWIFFEFKNPNRPIPSFLSFLPGCKNAPKTNTENLSHINVNHQGHTGYSPEVYLVDLLPCYGTLLALTRALRS
jgi:hypothetical protein